jgi:hypothetical protein
VIGSLLYEYRQPDQTEAGGSHGAATSALVEFDRKADRLRLRMRALPSRFSGLSTTSARGLQLTGSWTRQLSGRVGVDMSMSQDRYLRTERGSQINASWNTRLQLRVSRHVSRSGDLSGARFARDGAQAVDSLGTPAAISLDTRRFGNSIQYQVGRNRGSELGSHLYRDTLRVSLRTFMFTRLAAT